MGEHILKYDSMLALTHFKGHIVGGFGGSLKNISIGCTPGKVVTADSPAARRRKLSGRPAVHGVHGGRGHGYYHAVRGAHRLYHGTA